MELHEALTQISEIRLQMARTEVFRGYRSVPVAFSGLLALAAAGFQPLWVPEPTKNILAYLMLWIGVAAVSLLATGLEMWVRSQRSDSTLSREITWLAVQQFLPTLVAGVLVTYVLVSFAPDTVWVLPGLWQVLYSLGVFASCRLLPRATFWVAVYYMATGIVCLTLARGEATLTPWAMGVPFGIGQFFTAVILYWTLERNDVTNQDET